jgi:hypothetical protein
LNCGLLAIEEAHSQLIETRRYSNNTGALFGPDEVIFARVDRLDFPRDREAVRREVAAMPQPPGRAILGHQALIDLLLLHQPELKLRLVDSRFYSLMHSSECFVDVFDI